MLQLWQSASGCQASFREECSSKSARLGTSLLGTTPAFAMNLGSVGCAFLV